MTRKAAAGDLPEHAFQWEVLSSSRMAGPSRTEPAVASSVRLAGSVFADSMACCLFGAALKQANKQNQPFQSGFECDGADSRAFLVNSGTSNQPLRQFDASAGLCV